MTAIKNYKIDFIKRTKEILENNYQNFKTNDREVTFLLNCLLGLIIAISENEKSKRIVFSGNIDDSFIDLIPVKVGFLEKTNLITDFNEKDLTDFNLNVGHKDNLKQKDKFWFINKIRNGIAHQNIEGINDNNNWIGVRLWNSNNNTKDFEIIFTIDELRNMAIGFSNIYLSVMIDSKTKL